MDDEKFIAEAQPNICLEDELDKEFKLKNDYSTVLDGAFVVSGLVFAGVISYFTYQLNKVYQMFPDLLEFQKMVDDLYSFF